MVLDLVAEFVMVPDPGHWFRVLLPPPPQRKMCCKQVQLRNCTYQRIKILSQRTKCIVHMKAYIEDTRNVSFFRLVSTSRIYDRILAGNLRKIPNTPHDYTGWFPIYTN